MTVFADAWKARHGRLDNTFGEAFRLLPRARTDVNGRPSADPLRADVDFVAIMSETSVLANPQGRGIADNTATAQSTQTIEVDVADDALPYRPRRGDWISRKATGADYEIAAVRPDGIARTVLVLFRRSST